MSEIETEGTVDKTLSNPVQEPAQEVAPDSQNENNQSSTEVGELIAESKKYRNRAQTAESKLAKFEKKAQTERENQMAAQNKWQELAEERGSKLKEQEPVIEAAMAEIKTYREELLAAFSEEDKEAFGDLTLPQLKALHSKLIDETSTVVSTDGTPARSLNPENKNWTELPAGERRENWASILDSYRAKK